MLTQSEENYLKTIFKITERDRKTASTNDIAEVLKTSAASVTDMLKKLSNKDLVAYEKYKGASLSPIGNKYATDLVRKHRLWESFLVDKLGFSWEEVHDIAEQMEHIKSEELIDRLDQYLGRPKFDPHGDAIPNAQGKFTIRNQYILDVLDESEVGVLVGVRNNAQDFLEYLNDLNISLGTEFKVLQKIKFDKSIKVYTDSGDTLVFPKKVSSQLFVKKIK
jgi:DtxR family Mn-dependent transcriptional regulator